LVTLPDNPAFTAVSFLMAPLYCNMILVGNFKFYIKDSLTIFQANLNSRGYLQHGNNGPSNNESSEVVFTHALVDSPRAEVSFLQPFISAFLNAGVSSCRNPQLSRSEAPT
jgi:hypothetical protein